jgi:hypothetical protein
LQDRSAPVVLTDEIAARASAHVTAPTVLRMSLPVHCVCGFLNNSGVRNMNSALLTLSMA